MALFDWLFGGDDGGSTNTTTNVVNNQIPDWLQESAQANIAKAGDIAARPYPTYPGQRIAEFSGDTEAAFGATRGNQGAWSPALAQSLGISSDVATRPDMAPTQRFPEADISGYMNPYASAVTENAIREQERTGEMRRNRLGQKAGTSGVYGGDRHQVLEAEDYRNQDRLTSDMRMKGLDAAFKRATDQFNVDNQGQRADYGINLAGDASKLAAGGQMSTMADLMSSLGYRDAGALAGIGGAQEGKEQANYDLAYEDFWRQFGYPIEMLNLETSTTAGAPYSTTSTQTSTGPGPNNTASNIGLAMSLAGLAGQFFGS